jgi:hypothetical protein
MADPVVLVDSTPVVVGSLGGSVLVVVASVVVVGVAVVVGAVVGGPAVVVGPVTGGWVLVTPRVENASLLVVGPALAGAAAGPPAPLDLLMARGPAAVVEVERLGAVVGSRGPVGAIDTDLGTGWVGTVARAKGRVRRRRRQQAPNLTWPEPTGTVRAEYRQLSPKQQVGGSSPVRGLLARSARAIR